MSERHACRLLGQWRGTQRYEVIYRTDEDALTREIIDLASEYGRYGYRRIAAVLRDRGWHVLIPHFTKLNHNHFRGLSQVVQQPLMNVMNVEGYAENHCIVDSICLVELERYIVSLWRS